MAKEKEKKSKYDLIYENSYHNSYDHMLTDA